MRAYEDQIQVDLLITPLNIFSEKILRESQLEEKIQFDQEKKKLLKDLNALQLESEDERNLKVSKKIEGKRESFGEDYERNLKKGELKP